MAIYNLEGKSNKKCSIQAHNPLREINWSLAAILTIKLSETLRYRMTLPLPLIIYIFLFLYYFANLYFLFFVQSFNSRNKLTKAVFFLSKFKVDLMESKVINVYTKIPLVPMSL
jgi:hypothetical protein